MNWVPRTGGGGGRAAQAGGGAWEQQPLPGLVLGPERCGARSLKQVGLGGAWSHPSLRAAQQWDTVEA